MRIVKEIYDQMLAAPIVPPEIGGILGTSDKKIIDYVVFDIGLSKDNGGVYVPNTDFLNQNIEEWLKRGIEFEGIFHTHAPQWPDLSNADKAYIIHVLKAMPSSKQKLCFPLVFPGRNMKGYIAKRHGNIIDIIDDNIEILR